MNITRKISYHLVDAVLIAKFRKRISIKTVFTHIACTLTHTHTTHTHTHSDWYTHAPIFSAKSFKRGNLPHYFTAKVFKLLTSTTSSYMSKKRSHSYVGVLHMFCVGGCMHLSVTCVSKCQFVYTLHRG